MLELENHYPEIYKEVVAGNVEAKISEGKRFGKCELTRS